MKTVFVTLALTLIAACSKPSAAEQKKKEEELAAALSSAFGMPSARPKNGGPIELVTVSNKELGFTLSIPNDAKAMDMMSKGDPSSWMTDSWNGVSIGVHRSIGVKTLKDAVTDATTLGSKQIMDQKEIGKGTFLVITGPVLESESVSVFYGNVKGKQEPLVATCSGPLSDHKMLLEVCSSLKFTR
jgi:hypothetical protein